VSGSDGLLDILTEAFPRATADQIESAGWRLMARADTQRAEAEKRGALKALRRKAGDYALGDSPAGGPGTARDLDLYADAIERGEVTP
jgi:hypothetical protein